MVVMANFGTQVGEVGIGTLHESVTLDSGRTVEVGDVVGYDVRDLNPYRDPDTEPLVTSSVVTGTVEKIYNHNGEPDVTITNDHIGRIDAEDLQEEPERFDRFRSEIPEGDGCIIERWWGAFAESVEVEEEYTVEVNEVTE